MSRPSWVSLIDGSHVKAERANPLDAVEIVAATASASARSFTFSPSRVNTAAMP